MKKLVFIVCAAAFALSAFALCACNESKNEHTHTPVKTDAVAATCGHDGNVEYYTCGDCGKIFSDADCTAEITDTVIPATGLHTGGAATCTVKAKCDVCGAEYGELDAQAHSWGSVSYSWNEDKTECTAERECELSHDHRQSETATASENVTREATCTVAGSKTMTAVFENEAFSEQTETVSVDALEHDFSGGYHSDGDEHWKVCARDGCYAESEHAAHDFGNWVIDGYASCTTDGSRHRICETCGKQEDGVMDAVGHSYSFWYQNLKSDYKIGDTFSAHNGYYDWYDPTKPVTLVIRYWCGNANDVSGIVDSYEILDSEPFAVAGAQKVRFRAQIGEDSAEGEIDVKVYDDIAAIEGESALAPGSTGTGNYIVKSAADACGAANAKTPPKKADGSDNKWYQPGVYENTSGDDKGWMNEIKSGTYIELHIASDKACRAKIVMRAASFLVTEKAASDDWQGDAGQQASKTNPAKLEQAITVTYGGEQIAQDGTLAGVTSEDGKGHLWCNCYWTDVVIAEIDLVEGDNVLRIDFQKYNLINNNSCAIQIDAFTVMYGA